MSSDFSQIENSALSLPQEDRAKLASALLRSLEDLADDPRQVTEEWAEIILSRSNALHSNNEELVDGEETISEMRKLISNARSKDT